MPRKSSRKAKNIPSYDDDADTSPSTPRKGRKAVEVVAKSSAKGAKSVKMKAEPNDESEVPEPPRNIKINSAKAKAVLEEENAAKGKKPTAKRKIKDEDDEPEEPEEPVEGKSKKKRKTKEEKEAETMPLAARTLVGSLKKAMHIGAHVSAAGG